MLAPTTQRKETAMWKVTYLGLMGETSRTFWSKQEALEFIEFNAMIYPLPCVKLHDLRPFSELFDVLTEDQRDCLRAKLAAAIETSRVVENDYREFSDALDDDYPERIADITAGPEAWVTYKVMTQALSSLYDREREQSIMRDELRDVQASI